jgi:hypothetical protein
MQNVFLLNVAAPVETTEREGVSEFGAIAQLLFFFPVAQQPLVGQGHLIIEASRSHSDTPHTVGLLWTSDQPDAETSTWQHTKLTTIDRHPRPRPDSNLQSQQASGRRPTP